MTEARVLLADDHTMVAEGLGSLLRIDFDLVGTVTDGRALVEAAERLRPDVVVTDISMPKLNGLDAIRQLRSAGNQAKVVVLTMHADERLVAEAFRAGASCYLLKQSAGEELISAIHEALAGRKYLTPLVRKDLASVLADVSGATREATTSLPTPRQREVLRLIAEGRTMKEIAAQLQISTRTAETHKYDMMRELGLETTAELVQYAVKIGLVSL
jgi:DNA-binding NarL/FixJ family response regulator